MKKNDNYTKINKLNKQYLEIQKTIIKLIKKRNKLTNYKYIEKKNFIDKEITRLKYILGDIDIQRKQIYLNALLHSKELSKDAKSNGFYTNRAYANFLSYKYQINPVSQVTTKNEKIVKKVEKVNNKL